MNIDKSSFVLLVTTIAASGAGGWFARDRLMLRSELENQPAPSAKPEPPPPPPSASASPAAIPEPAAPKCDDSEGAIPDCKGLPGPGDEDDCFSLVRGRCAQYKESFKPKPARAAIECLKRLRGNQVCNLIAVNKCGHEALMASCTPQAASDAGAPAEIDQTCEKILASPTCKGATPGPTLADCKQTLSGLNPIGRTKMITCMQKLCSLHGLYGCEAR